jgi:hypothetical protein
LGTNEFLDRLRSVRSFQQYNRLTRMPVAMDLLRQLIWTEAVDIDTTSIPLETEQALHALHVVGMVATGRDNRYSKSYVYC